MKFGFDMSESSTKRGLVWLISFVIGCLFVWNDKSPEFVMFMASGVAGAIGAIIKDSK